MTDQETTGEDRLVAQKEAARILGIAVSTLRANPEVKFVELRGRTGGQTIRRYRLSELYRYIDAHTVDPMQAAS